MDVRIDCRNIPMAPRWKTTVNQYLEKLENNHADLTHARVTLEKNLHHKKGQVATAQVVLSVRGRTITAHKTDKTFEQAIKAAFLAAHFLAGTETYILWGFGDTGRSLHRELLRHGKRPSHVVEVHPGRLGNVIHGAPVVAYDRLPRLPRRPVVVSVAGEEPRRQIREALAAMGFRELQDFVCAA